MVKLIKRTIKYAKKGTKLGVETVAPVVLGDSWDKMSDEQKAQYTKQYNYDWKNIDKIYESKINEESNNIKIPSNLNLNTSIAITPQLIPKQDLKYTPTIKQDTSYKQLAEKKYGTGVKKGSNSAKWTYQRNKANELFGTKFNSAEDVRQFQINHGLKGDGMLGQDTLRKLNEEYNENIKFSQIRYVVPKSESNSKKKESENNVESKDNTQLYDIHIVKYKDGSKKYYAIIDGKKVLVDYNEKTKTFKRINNNSKTEPSNKKSNNTQSNDSTKLISRSRVFTPIIRANGDSITLHGHITPDEVIRYDSIEYPNRTELATNLRVGPDSIPVVISNVNQIDDSDVFYPLSRNEGGIYRSDMPYNGDTFKESGWNPMNKSNRTIAYRSTTNKHRDVFSETNERANEYYNGKDFTPLYTQIDTIPVSDPSLIASGSNVIKNLAYKTNDNKIVRLNNNLERIGRSEITIKKVPTADRIKQESDGNYYLTSVNGKYKTKLNKKEIVSYLAPNVVVYEWKDNNGNLFQYDPKTKKVWQVKE